MSGYWPDHPDRAASAARRRERLVERLEARGIDAALINDPPDIMYFTGAPLGASAAPACLLVRRTAASRSRGEESLLVCGESETVHSCDRTVTYPWHTGGTIHSELLPSLIARAAPVIGRGRAGERIGVQTESAPAQLLHALGVSSWTPIDADVLDLERANDELSLAGIVAATDANLAAYDAVRSMLAPGLTELDVYTTACRAAINRAGRRVVHDGDYRCGAPNGPPRCRRIEAGELYIIDAWTQDSGYWSDLARTFVVSEPASTLQRELIEHVASVHARIRPMLQPGTACTEIWLAMDAMLREFPPLSETGLVHHGGHGIGLRLHAPPDINHHSPDSLRAGDVVCIEPGGYPAAARAGVRSEQMYLITETRPRCLSTDSDRPGDAALTGLKHHC